MAETFGLTHTLAFFLGLYFLAAGAGLLHGRDDMRAMMEELLARPLLAYFGAVIAFITGAAIVGLHNRWDTLLEGAVSFVGWIALAEGILMLAAGNKFLRLVSRIPLTPRAVTIFSVVTIGIGALLMFVAINP